MLVGSRLKAAAALCALLAVALQPPSVGADTPGVVPGFTPGQQDGFTPGVVPGFIPGEVPHTDGLELAKTGDETRPGVVPGFTPGQQDGFTPGIVPGFIPGEGPQELSAVGKESRPGVVPGFTPGQQDGFTPGIVPGFIPGEGPHVDAVELAKTGDEGRPGVVPGFTPGQKDGFTPGVVPGFIPGEGPHVDAVELAKTGDEGRPGVVPGFTPGQKDGFTPGVVPGFIPGEGPHVDALQLAVDKDSRPGVVPGFTPGQQAGFTPGIEPGFIPGEGAPGDAKQHGTSGDTEKPAASGDETRPGVVPGFTPGQKEGFTPGIEPGFIPGEGAPGDAKQHGTSGDTEKPAASGDEKRPGVVPGFTPGQKEGFTPGIEPGFIPGEGGPHVDTHAGSKDAPAATAKPKEEVKTPASTIAGPRDSPDVPDYEWYWKHGEASMFSGDSGVFKNFRPNDTDQTCSQDAHATPFNKQVRGVNLGGWLVLEPWIVPTLFYQFLNTQQRYGDKAPEKTAMDMYTFCTALGKEEANRQLRIHYDNWVTEDDIKELAEAGINSLRVPVGDWMFNPYEPYSGCTDGAVEALDRVADLALKYDLDILLDIHGLIGSQNGFDNSGKSASVKWTSIASTQPVGTTTFEHWPIRQAEWAGTFNVDTHNYTSINYSNLNHSIVAVEAIINRYKGHKAIIGLEPVNEPWELTPITVLKEYYWKSYKRMKVLAPSWKFVIHDSFRFGLTFWADFLKGCPDIALDTHIYQAWNPPGTVADFFSNACQQKFVITDMENAMMPVIVGEWSLGTDNCAMWLNGFNDNLPGFPKVQCRMVDCPINSTYLGEGFPGTPLDKNKPIQGPYGTGMSGPSFGKCPVTSNTSFGQDDDAGLTRALALKRLNAFSFGHGWYFWNFKTEFTSKWSFLDLVREGMFPKNVSDYHESEGVESACLKEDKGDFVCAAKRGVHTFELKDGLAYACNFPEIDCSDIEKRFLTLEEQCDWAFNEYWHLNREKGATCDFGGAAHLMNVPGAATTEVPVVVPHPTKKAKQSTGHLLFSVAKWSVAAIMGFVVLVVAFIAGAIFAVVRWRQNRVRRQYSPIGSRV